ncbi:MAG TPA: hypothetical protein VLB76_09965 [Thermoanaerobaculia bacterium]|nr:hypothetical protein [Thermoanaerobaculia bacterium]
MRLRNFLMVGLALTLLFPFAASAVDWTAVGSTGAIDEGSLAVYATNDASLFFASGTTGNIISYFNVVNNSGTDTPPWTTLDLTSKDGSANSNVTAVLYRVPKCSGSALAVCSALSSETSTTPVCTSCSTGQLDFANNAYFIKVLVDRSAITASPAFYGLRLR